MSSARRARVIGVGIVDLKTTKGGGGARHVAELHQAHARHFPHAGASGGGIGVVSRNLRLDRRQQAQAFAYPVLIHQGQGAQAGRFSNNELVDNGHRFFGSVSRGLAQAVEAATKRWGQPNGYILGQEAGGALWPAHHALPVPCFSGGGTPRPPAPGCECRSRWNNPPRQP